MIYTITCGDVRTILNTNHWMQLLCNYPVHGLNVIMSSFNYPSKWCWPHSKMFAGMQAMVSVFGTVFAYLCTFHQNEPARLQECKNATCNTPWCVLANALLYAWGLHHSMSFGRSTTIKTYSAAMKSGCHYRYLLTSSLDPSTAGNLKKNPANWATINVATSQPKAGPRQKGLQTQRLQKTESALVVTWCACGHGIIRINLPTEPLNVIGIFDLESSPNYSLIPLFPGSCKTLSPQPRHALQNADAARSAAPVKQLRVESSRREILMALR